MISYNWELNNWMSIILQIWDNFSVISSQVLIKKKQNTRKVYQHSRLLTPHLSTKKGNSKFKSYSQKYLV